VVSSTSQLRVFDHCRDVSYVVRFVDEDVQVRTALFGEEE
jgi:hypothetical protein